MEDENSSNKRIVKNTIYLYLRSFLMMAIGLYTSRIILQVLGIGDFGLYGVIGSTVAMFTIINGVLTVGTSRFLTFELGRNNPEQLRKVFSASFAMHCAMAVVLLILFETIGLWFLNNKISIPEGRELAANVCYQLSVASCLLGLTQVPYGAAINAHEKFDLYAYIGIGEAIFKLALPASLLFFNFEDNLIAYATIITLWSVGLQIFYRIYCIRHFPESRLSIVKDKSVYKSMLSYSLWDLLGQISSTGCSQGLNILINMFFGVNANAARAIAYQVEGKIDQFVGNFLASVNPQIVKAYARKDYHRFFQLINESGRYGYWFMFFFALPVLLETDYLLSIWLTEVPEWTSLFFRGVMCIVLVRCFSRPLIHGVHATGNVKILNLTSGLYTTLTFLPFIYLFYANGFPVWSCLYVQALGALVCTYLEARALKKNIDYNMTQYFLNVHVRTILTSLLAIMPPLAVMFVMQQGFFRFLTSLIVSIVSTIFVVYFWGLNDNVRKKVKVRIRTIIQKYV